MRRSDVFPTRVGMVRCSRCRSTVLTVFSPPAWGWSGADVNRPERREAAGFPHPRGDGPSCRTDTSWRRADVFPTRVGMVRTADAADRAAERFSPPAWGWSVTYAHSQNEVTVFPTRVGMVRLRAPVSRAQRSFPHPRGDGPPGQHRRYRLVQFSPPAWGWSAMR